MPFLPFSHFTPALLVAKIREMYPAVSRCFSLFLAVSCCFSPFLTVSRRFLQFLTVSHRSSLFHIVSHRFSLFLTVSHSFSPFVLVVSFSLLPFLIVSHRFSSPSLPSPLSSSSPLQHFENAGEFLGFFDFLRFYYQVRTPSALGQVRSVYCCHFSPFSTFLIQNSHSLLRSSYT